MFPCSDISRQVREKEATAAYGSSREVRRLQSFGHDGAFYVSDKFA
jgi:hypothetical protein